MEPAVFVRQPLRGDGEGKGLEGEEAVKRGRRMAVEVKAGYLWGGPVRDRMDRTGRRGPSFPTLLKSKKGRVLSILPSCGTDPSAHCRAGR